MKTGGALSNLGFMYSKTSCKIRCCLEDSESIARCSCMRRGACWNTLAGSCTLPWSPTGTRRTACSPLCRGAGGTCSPRGAGHAKARFLRNGRTRSKIRGSAGGRIRPQPAQKRPIARTGHLGHRAPDHEALSESPSAHTVHIRIKIPVQT